MSSRNTKKKKAVAAILLVLCAAMLSLLLVIRMQGGKDETPATGGGGGGGGGAMAPAQSAPQVGQQTLPAPQDQASQGQASQGQAPQGQAAQPAPQPPAQTAPAAGADAPDLRELTWTPYDINAVVYSFHRVLILDEDRVVVSQKDLGQADTRLSLEGLGLDENRRYWYRVVPVAKPDTDMSGSVRVQQGTFYVNLTDEAPTAPAITAPANGSSVANLRPTLEWRASADNDPHDAPALRYEVSLSRPGAGKVWSAETTDTQIEAGENLRENESYVLHVVAVDPEGLKSPIAEASFSVNAAKDKPSVPGHLSTAADASAARYELKWYGSTDPNPGGAITGYEVQVRDEATGQVVWSGSTGSTWVPFAKGEYGKSYAFRVRSRNNFKVASGYSSWSSPFAFTFNYTFVPAITSPAFSKEGLTARQSLAWTAGPDVREYVLTIDTAEYRTAEPSLPLLELFEKGLIRIGEQYILKVRAVNEHDFVTDDSPATMFTLADSPPLPPGKPVVEIAEPGRKEFEDEDVISWGGATDLEGDVVYELQMSLTEDFAELFVSHATKENSVVFDAIWDGWRRLEWGAFCFARVVATDSAGNVTFGPSRKLIKHDD